MIEFINRALFTPKNRNKELTLEAASVEGSEVLDITEFSSSLTDTKKWCASLIDINNPKFCFRTSLLEEYLAKQHGPNFEPMSFWPTPEEIDQTLSIKKQALKHMQQQDIPKGNGRIVLCFPESSNFNALSSDSSNGYLDEHDIPPWDTWIGQIEISKSEFLLLAWVPDEFVKLVELGIEVECMGMLYWANSKYWGKYTTPDNRYLNCVPKWVFDHESAKT